MYFYGKWLSFLFVIILFCSVVTKEGQSEQVEDLPPSQNLKINIICRKNGVGLGRDIQFLQSELNKLGHQVHYVDVFDLSPPPHADINIIVEFGNTFFYPFAKKNYLIPNPEWCYLSDEEIAKFDKILCRTKEGERIFKSINPNTIYLGFTCDDHYDDKIAKNYKAPLHIAGASIHKGTDPLIKMWLKNPQFPPLLLLKHAYVTSYPPDSNLVSINEYLSNERLVEIQNQYGLHICPSETEGFGYYISEALSCGAVVVTTDAPPMNEFVSDPRCLVGYNHSEACCRATRYLADPDKLESAIAKLLSLPEEELIAIGHKNREKYLENGRLFREKFAALFNSSYLQTPLPVKSLKPTGEKLKINIISNRNGVGLSQDADILTAELEKLGHSVTFIEDSQFSPDLQKVDINIFNQPLPQSAKNSSFLSLAPLNYLFPNPEWCYFTEEELKKFDLILCKTKEAERIFNAMNLNTCFLGFTSKDCYQENVDKDYKHPMHLAGASAQKGTDGLIHVWANNPQFPLLTMIKHKEKGCYPSLNNLKVVFEYLNPTTLRTMQNQHGMHICPSETEGFGHYIVEAMSCGAVVVTTDAPPMNEFISDKRCLVPYSKTTPLNLAMSYHIDPNTLESAIANLLSLSNEELKNIGQKNREAYLEKDLFFKKRLVEVFGDAYSNDNAKENQ